MKNYELTKEEYLALSKESKKSYDSAMFWCRQECARDWSFGHELLRKLGWTEQERSEGHRIFVSLTKPSDLSHLSEVQQ